MKTSTLKKSETKYAPFTVEIIKIISAIPYGKVNTYGNIARMAGQPNGARQVVRILSTLSQRENLPWHRVVRKDGKIALSGAGELEQILLLRDEGVDFVSENQVDMKKCSL